MTLKFEILKYNEGELLLIIELVDMCMEFIQNQMEVFGETIINDEIIIISLIQ